MAAVALASTTSSALSMSASATLVMLAFDTTGTASLQMTATATVVNMGLVSDTSASLEWLPGEAALDVALESNTSAGLTEATADASVTIEPDVVRFEFSAGYSGEFRPSIASNLTVRDAAREVYALWGMELDPRNIEFARERVLNAINAAIQTIHAQAHRLDYFNKQELTATVAAAASSVTLSKTVQGIRGPVKLSSGNVTLRKITSRAEFDNFTAYYYGESTVPSEPRAYYIDASNESKGDNVAITLHVTPTPVDETILKYEASVEPARYIAADIFAATELQIPAKFTETLFLPLIRKWAIGDTLFSKESIRADIEAKYTTAMQTLGLLDPDTPELKPRKAAA